MVETHLDCPVCGESISRLYIHRHLRAIHRLPLYEIKLMLTIPLFRVRTIDQATRRVQKMNENLSEEKKRILRFEAVFSKNEKD